MTIEQYENAVSDDRIRRKLLHRKMNRFLSANGVPRRINDNKLGLRKRKLLAGIQEE